VTVEKPLVIVEGVITQIVVGDLTYVPRSPLPIKRGGRLKITPRPDGTFALWTHCTSRVFSLAREKP